MTNWFCWLDGNISCCTDMENSNYYIGHVSCEVLEIVIRTIYNLRQELNISHYELFGLRDADSSKEVFSSKKETIKMTALLSTIKRW